MPIEMTCAGCHQTLRVADEHAGKKARCPQCATIVQVPAGADGALPDPPVPATNSAASFGNPPVFKEHPDAAARVPHSAPNPFADRPEERVNPYASPHQAGVRTWQTPHRGGLILAFGILGLVFCALFGVAAWVMGANDLKEIDAGRMDPEGRGLTQGGMILGIVATALLALGLVGGLGLMCLSVAFA